MADAFTLQKTYIDEFNPKVYLQTYYVAKEGILLGQWTEFVLKILHENFTKGNIRGETLLDFGTGPTIYQLLSACEVFDKIVVSDFLPQNCTEFQKWLNKDPEAFDWTHIIKFVCELEGNREDYEKKAEKLRSKVKEVLTCDALKRNPFDPVIVPPVDCLLSCLCLECACTDIKSYCNVLKNFLDLIKPGGHLMIFSGLNATFYNVGETYFSSMTNTKENLEMVFKEAGYQIENTAYEPRADESRDFSDFDTLYFIHARKPM